MAENNQKWLTWARKLQAIAQSGLAYCTNDFDIERLHQVQHIAAEMMAEGSDQPFAKVLHIFEGQDGYATPKIDCRGVIMLEDTMLFVRELSDGGWTLPGGWVDVGEPLSQAVEREVREESGWQVSARRLLAVYDRDLHGHPPYPFHSYKIFVQCDLILKREADPLETTDATFFSEKEIPPLSLLRTTPEEITRLFHLCRNPALPAEFD